MQEIPLGGYSKDFNSKKAASTSVNMYLTRNDDGSFKQADRTEGLTEWVSFGPSNIRSNFILANDFLYFVAGGFLWRTESNKNTVNLGVVGGANRAVLIINNEPLPEILILNGSGDGFVYDTNALTLTQVTAPEFVARRPRQGDFLNGRAWLVDTQNNTFFGSALNDFMTYPASTVASANEHPDKILNIEAVQSALHVIGEKTTEYWQSVNDPNLPLRRVNGATMHHGTLSENSVARLDDMYCFLSEEKGVQLVKRTSEQKISDLDFELPVKGDGTERYKGFSVLDDAYGFWIDGAFHKVYCITFPTEKFTWCFDFATGTSHLRNSKENAEFIGFWRVNQTIDAFGTTLAADYDRGVIWELTPDAKGEGDEILTGLIRTQSVSRAKNFTIPRAELDMETGVSNINANEALLQWAVSKDGGKTFDNKNPRPLGIIGDYRKRVPLYDIGRTVRYKDLVFEFQCSAPVRFTFYGLYADIQESMF